MLVCRFENDGGFGPYTGRGCIGPTQLALRSALMNAHCDGDGYHNPIWEDVKGFESGDMFCCCLSIESLKCWFDGFVEQLFEAGYQICCYDVPESDVLRGRRNNQAAFAWENAELVERIR